jgi:hypothetical protein
VHRLKNTLGDSMKTSQFTPDTIAELLVYLADRETFPSLKSLKNWSKQDVKTVFEELAANLRQSASKEPIVRKSQINAQEFNDKTRKIINKLTPQEEEILLKSFKISS